MRKLSFAVALVLWCAPAAFAAKQYSYFRVGNQADVTATTNQGVTSSQALADPFTRYITLGRTLPASRRSPGSSAIRTSSPATAWAAISRSCAGSTLTAGWSAAPRDIAIDERTALLIDDRASATVVGSGTVYFIQAPGAPEVCEPKTPLTYQNIAVYRITSSGSFDLGRWTGRGGTSYFVSATAGVVSSTQPGGAIY